MSGSLKRGLDALREQLDTDVATFFSACTHCGLCADACLFHTETGDPAYTPILKLEPLKKLYEQEFTLTGRFKSWLGLSDPLTLDDLEKWKPFVYDSCTLCGRCSMICPVGNDLVGMVRKLREGMVAAGCAPDDLVSAARRNLKNGSPLGVTLETLKAQIVHIEAETGLTIPLDKPNAHYMLVMSSMEIVQFPEFLSAVARIFHQADISWTMASDAFEAVNSGVQIGSNDITAKILMRTVRAAQALGVKTVVCPECGHAYTAMRWEGPNVLGHALPFEVRHIIEVLDQLHQEGRLHLRTDGLDPRPLTYHDPCQIARRGGVIQQPRRLLKAISDDFRDMREHGEMNWCCGGGGGVSALEHTEPLRARVFRRKKRQLEELGVKILVTACTNCRMILEEDLEKHEMNIQVMSLTEMVADHLVAEGKARFAA